MGNFWTGTTAKTRGIRNRGHGVRVILGLGTCNNKTAISAISIRPNINYSQFMGFFYGKTCIFYRVKFYFHNTSRKNTELFKFHHKVFKTLFSRLLGKSSSEIVIGWSSFLHGKYIMARSRNVFFSMVRVWNAVSIEKIILESHQETYVLEFHSYLDKTNFSQEKGLWHRQWTLLVITQNNY